MNREELVSVIIPTYNRAGIVPRAITSVLNQTYKNVELIVVDDGSTDDTEKRVKGCADTRIRYIRHPGNKGKSASRNAGINASKGEFVAFLDSDDEYFPEKIAKSIETFRDVSHRIGMVASNYYIISDHGKRLGNPDLRNMKRISPKLSTWVIRRTIFEQIGYFDERMPVSQDVDFFKRFRKKSKLYFIQYPLVNVYVSEDGTFSSSAKHILTREKTVENLRGDSKLYAEHLKYLGKDLWALGKTKEARDCYLKAFFAAPLHFRYLFKYIRSLFQKQ